MVMEALSSNEFLNFIIYDTISATPFTTDNGVTTTTSTIFSSLENIYQYSTPSASSSSQSLLMNPHQQYGVGITMEAVERKGAEVVARGKKKRRRKARVCKNKEEAENQRMTHIAVERNRRKLMNEHLSILRSLMPESYVQRGDQASIVGGAIEYVKELEYILQSLEAQKLQLLQIETSNEAQNQDTNNLSPKFHSPPFSQFFVYPQFSAWSQIPSKITSKTKAAIADIEVTLIETHASIRILSRQNPRQLSKLVAGFQSLYLSVLHLNVTTMDNLVLYSISAKVEEGCQLTSVDDIAGAVHHMLRLIEEEAAANIVDGVLTCL